LASVIAHLESVAPPVLAESWDNVGLLAGDPQSDVRRIMTCLTIFPETVSEAIHGRADLIVAHHPLPFRPLQRIVTSNAVGQSLWPVIRAGISIYSPHTAWDNAAQGINQRWAEMLELVNVCPIHESPSSGHDGKRVGAGRVGDFVESQSLAEIVARLKIKMPTLRATTNFDAHHRVDRVAIVCGSGGSFVEAARQANANLLFTGEATYHQCLEARSLGLAMLMIGHFASERFSMDILADLLTVQFPSLDVWASRTERDSVFAIE
jgi:dinuclear metal center YbgI/SA1388 family protein